MMRYELADILFHPTANFIITNFVIQLWRKTFKAGGAISIILLLNTCIYVCFLALHHEYVRKHTHLHWITTRKTAHAYAWSTAKIFL